MGDLIQMRDFKRKEEREAADVRFAKQVMGLTSVSLSPGVVDYEMSTHWIDTAPCELPQVWPDFQHSTEKDPA